MSVAGKTLGSVESAVGGLHFSMGVNMSFSVQSSVQDWTYSGLFREVLSVEPDERGE
jgi:hypothetical protein